MSAPVFPDLPLVRSSGLCQESNAGPLEGRASGELAPDRESLTGEAAHATLLCRRMSQAQVAT